MGLMVAVGAATVISVTTVLESVAIVGAVLSVAGAVTKNKTLSMIGMGLGIVGGVGALASSALGGSAAIFGEAAGGSFAGEAGAVSEVGSAAASGGVEAGAFDSTLGGVVAGGAEAGGGGAIAAGGQTLDMIDSLASAPAVGAADSPVINTASTPGIASAEEMGSGFLTAGKQMPTDLTTGATTATDTSTAAASPSVSTATSPAAAGTTPGASVASDVTGGVDTTSSFASGAAPGSASTGSGTASTGTGGMFGKLIDYAGSHPVLAMGAVQAGGSLLSGMFSSVTPAQAALYNAQAAQNQAAANMIATQTANLQAPKAVASTAPVTGAPKELVPGYNGLINQTARPNVTGAVA